VEWLQWKGSDVSSAQPCSAEGQRAAFKFPQAEEGRDSQLLPFSKKICYKAPPKKSQ